MGPKAERPRILLTHPVGVKQGFPQHWQALSVEFAAAQPTRRDFSKARGVG